MSLTSSSAPITNGTATTADPAVVAITDVRPFCDQLGANVTCTGTIIAPRLVLTAAHCVRGRPADSFEVFVGPRVGPNVAEGVFHRVVEVISADTKIDIALIRLGTTPDVTPLPYRTTALRESDVGRTGRVVGYGLSNSKANDSGTKRQGTASLLRFDARTVTVKPTPSLACSGDSGGPLLLTDPMTSDGREFVAGVTSGSDPSCLIEAEYARTDLVAAFLDAEVAKPEPALPEVGKSDACGATCTESSSCGAGRLCQTESAEKNLCGAVGFPAGGFGDSCNSDVTCKAGACLAVTSKGARSCRCYTTCDPTMLCNVLKSPAASRPMCVIGIPTKPEGPGDDNGCHHGAPYSSASPWIYIVFVGMALRVRRNLSR